MATVTAFTSFNLLDLDLHRLVAYFDYWTFDDNLPRTINGITYSDAYEVVWGGQTRATAFGGDGLVVDPFSGAVTGGTVTAVVEGYYSGGWNLSFAVQGIAVSGFDLYLAATTASTADDDSIISSVLSGSDSFHLSSGNDVVTGYTGNDLILGNLGNDALDGDAGADVVKAGGGNDLLGGGTGKDRLTGGTGNDTFAFGTPKDGGDLITDFHNRRGDNDRIWVDDVWFRGGLDKGRISSSEFQASTDNQADSGAARFIFRTTDETLWFDRNGDRAGGLTLIADLQNNASLTSHDIMVM